MPEESIIQIGTMEDHMKKAVETVTAEVIMETQKQEFASEINLNITSGIGTQLPG